MPEQIQFEDHDKAIRAFHANQSLRYRRLDALERWANGTQYEGRQSWWDDKDDVPLWERAPCIVYPVVAIASGSNVDLCLGEGRFPEFTSNPAEDEDNDEGGLDEEQSAQLDRFLAHLHRVSRFRSHSRDAFQSAQHCGTVCVIHGARNGKPFNDLVPAKWCNPTFDSDGNVAELEIQYPFIEDYRKGSMWAKRARLYRRVINDKSDTEFHVIDAREDGSPPDPGEWKPNKERSGEHGLGFCPVVWYALMKGATTVNVVDGKAIHAKVTDEIQAHDIARSQWHRGALYSEPQVCEFGVQPGFNPTDTGRKALIPQTEAGGDNIRDPDTIVTGHIVDAGYRGSKARKKGPGFTWQYPNPKSRVELLEYPPEALRAQQDNASDLRIKLQESLAVVFLDPENIKFAATTSGKALEAIKQKQLDRCDQYRDDLAEGFFEPSIAMQLRIAHAILKRGQRLRVQGAAKILPVLEKLLVSDGDGQFWQMPTMSTKYGAYFAPDPGEQQKIVELVQTALGKNKGTKAITLAVALRKISSIFGIENVEAVLEELEKEQAQEGAQRDESEGDISEDASDEVKDESDEDQAA